MKNIFKTTALALATAFTFASCISNKQYTEGLKAKVDQMGFTIVSEMGNANGQGEVIIKQKSDTAQIPKLYTAQVQVFGDGINNVVISDLKQLDRLSTVNIKP